MDSQPRRGISKAVLKRLYADFGGLCVFPNCPSPNRLPDGTPILEVAHIVSTGSGGPRSDPRLQPEEIVYYSNLILVCPTHHVVIDQQPLDYPAEALRSMRDRHLQRVAAIPVSAQQNSPETSGITNRLEQALKIWECERRNSSEEFWQSTFANRPELLAPAT